MKRIATAIVAGLFGAVLLAGPALANPSPPTNGGNGGGSSGQCTGNPDDRPAGCH